MCLLRAWEGSILWVSTDHSMRQYLISQLPSILRPGEAVQAGAEVLAEVHQAAVLAVAAAGAGNKPSRCTNSKADVLQCYIILATEAHIAESGKSNAAVICNFVLLTSA